MILNKHLGKSVQEAAEASLLAMATRVTRLETIKGKPGLIKTLPLYLFWSYAP
jgi:hypothetical protein